MSPAVASFISACVMSLGICFLLFLGEGISSALLTTFLLAGAAGYQAVWGVAHALHTPLMSVTNAISGSTAIGGILLLFKLQADKADTDTLVATVLAYIAIGFSAVNIVGGFV